MKNNKANEYPPIVIELKDLIEKNGWEDNFIEAIGEARSLDLPIIGGMFTLEDYYNYLEGFIKWTPKETKGDTRLVYDHLVAFYFFMEYKSVKTLQSPNIPGSPVSVDDLTALSKWIIKCGKTWGDYLDTTESASEVHTFKEDPWFNWDEYMAPPSGYLTFNEFFARHTKPGMRPVAGLNDNSVIVSQADCTMVDWWRIGENSKINLQQTKKVGCEELVIQSKIFKYSIEELLKDSKYADRFKGGIFMHSFLNSTDYHRWNSPVQGKVLEARVIQGQNYLGVGVDKVIEVVDGKEVERNHLSALDGTGYQFNQARGLIIIDSPFGLVACLPMGMAQVSSVTITAEEGVTLRKGEELGYFKFGGSDFVMCFERSSNVQITTRPNEHVQQGTCIGKAYPYSMK